MLQRCFSYLVTHEIQDKNVYNYENQPTMLIVSTALNNEFPEVLYDFYLEMRRYCSIVE